MHKATIQGPSQWQTSGMVETIGLIDTRKGKGLRRIDMMSNVGLFSKAKNMNSNRADRVYPGSR